MSVENFGSDLGNHIGLISGIVAGVGVIVTSIISFFKFVNKVNKKLDFIAELESNEILDQVEDLSAALTEHDQFINELKNNNVLDNVKKVPNIEDTLHRQDELLKDLQDIKEMLKELTVAFQEHLKANALQSDLMINQVRYTLGTTMKSSIDRGWATIEEKQAIGDLYASYCENKGNFGMKDVFDIYKNLPVKTKN